MNWYLLNLWILYVKIDPTNYLHAVLVPIFRKLNEEFGMDSDCSDGKTIPGSNSAREQLVFKKYLYYILSKYFQVN